MNELQNLLKQLPELLESELKKEDSTPDTATDAADKLIVIVLGEQEKDHG